MGIPVQYDEFGRPVCPRFANPPQTQKPEKQDGTWEATTAVREWLKQFKESAGNFAEDTGCNRDTILLVFAGFVSQDPQVVADALGKNVRWVRPRVERLRTMGLWTDGTTPGPRFGTWIEGTSDDPNAEVEPAIWVPILLDILEIEGELESRENEAGELEFHIKKQRPEADGRTKRRGPRKTPKDKFAAYRQRNVAEGRCPRCGKKPETDLVLCNTCRAKKIANYAKNAGGHTG